MTRVLSVLLRSFLLLFLPDSLAPNVTQCLVRHTVQNVLRQLTAFPLGSLAVQSACMLQAI